MKVLGVDPSSASTGIAIVDDGDLIYTKIWKPDDDKDTAPTRLLKYYNWIVWQSKLCNADIAAVEHLAVFQNKKVVRALSHYEAASIIACKKTIQVVVTPQVTEARGIVFGKGNLGKEESFVRVKKMFPDHKFLPKTRGGMDESDAIVLALAAPIFAERRR